MSDTELTVADVLARAADLIEPKGAWAQGGYNPREGCYCALGAIAAVAVGEIRGNWENPDMRLARAAGKRVFGHLGTLADWNDEPQRTQPEVVAKLREAAALARAGAA